MHHSMHNRRMHNHHQAMRLSGLAAACGTVCVCMCDAQVFQSTLKLRGSTELRPMIISETMSPCSSGLAGGATTSTVIHSFGMWERSQEP